MTKRTDKELLDLCNEYLSYNPQSGVMSWMKKTSSLARVKLGSPCTKIDSNGYLAIHIKGKTYKQHRIAYLMVNGHLPGMIDHINGIKNDNRISNLRECTPSENSLNRGANKYNSSGYKGVYLEMPRNSWRVKISQKGNISYLGYFKCKHEAARVWNTAARMYHGKFAYTNKVMSC